MFDNSGVQECEVPDVLLIGNLVQRVGMEPKTIRFYEKAGLIKPHRAGSYRIYNNRDVELLKVIKFLRSLDMSIRIIRDLLNSHGRLRMESLPEEAKLAISQQLSRREEEYRKLEAMCRPILMSTGNFNDNDTIAHPGNTDGTHQGDT